MVRQLDPWTEHCILSAPETPAAETLEGQGSLRVYDEETEPCIRTIHPLLRWGEGGGPRHSVSLSTMVLIAGLSRGTEAVF